MKKIYLLLLTTLILASCGDKKEQSLEDTLASNNVEQIRAKKTEIEQKQRELAVQLDSLNAAISKLDTVKKQPLVTTFVAEKTVFNHYLELQGNVATKQNVLVYPEMGGILKSVYVKEGQYVRKGQILARVDDGGMSQQLAQAENQAALAKTSFERQKRLWDQKIGSEIQFLQAESNYISQTKVVAQIKSQLSRATIRAPFSGIVDEVLKEQGTVVAPGMGAEVFRIINLKNMYIEAEVPESYINNITEGKKAEVFFPVLAKTIDAEIRQVGNFINPNNRSFKVEIAVPNKEGNIKPNLTAKIKLNDYTNPEAFLIPQSIISENADGEQYVYVVKNSNANNEGAAERVIIETGKTQGDVIEVLSGVTDGTEIIKEGARSVKNGQTVKVIKY